jgi:hypothetical protein
MNTTIPTSQLGLIKKSRVPRLIKAILFLIFSFSIAEARAAGVVYRSAYSKETVLQGIGNTRDEAARDALCSIPSGWELDPGNSPAWDCLVRQSPRSDKRDIDGLCSSEFAGNKIVFSVPLVPKDLKEREVYWDVKPWLKKPKSGQEKRGDGWYVEKLCGK